MWQRTVFLTLVPNLLEDSPAWPLAWERELRVLCKERASKQLCPMLC